MPVEPNSRGSLRGRRRRSPRGPLGGLALENLPRSRDKKPDAEPDNFVTGRWPEPPSKVRSTEAFQEVPGQSSDVPQRQAFAPWSVTVGMACPAIVKASIDLSTNS